MERKGFGASWSIGGFGSGTRVGWNRKWIVGGESGCRIGLGPLLLLFYEHFPIFSKIPRASWAPSSRSPGLCPHGEDFLVLICSLWYLFSSWGRLLPTLHLCQRQGEWRFVVQRISLFWSHRGWAVVWNWTISCAWSEQRVVRPRTAFRFWFQ